ncbi:MAG: cytochrome P450 [Alphaproteobacteria bacterium]|nr:cytochrome P450 [Alphaproteobacteria bacterium]
MNVKSVTEAEAEMLARGFDVTRPTAEFYRDPYPTYRALRRYSPVHRCADGSFFLTRYADLDLIYRDTRRFRSDKRREFAPKYGLDTPLYRHHTTSLVFNDPPLHTRVRRLIAGALTPRAIRSMEPDLVRLVDDLLDRIEDKRHFDLIDDFASAIPVEVIGNLLRVPHADRAPLRGWSLAILGALEATLTPEQLARGHRAVEEFTDYLKILVADRRRNLGDESDVLSRLIRGEQDGERLTEEELLQNCIFLLNAGHETTTNLIGNGLHLLLTHDAELARLRADPALIRSAVEECLRYESSNQLGNRTVAEPVELGGIPLPAGTYLTLCIGAANRDPAEFADPERFDIGRQANRHLAFGGGPHVCAGLALARLEGQIAIGRMIRRLPRLRLDGDPVRGGRARFRGFLSLPAAVS